LRHELISPCVALREGEVHLWRAYLNVDADTLAALSRTLSADEHERSHRFHFERDRIRWTTGRGWLRQLLAGYLDADPAELCFDQHPFGKPRLAACARWLRFNVSHAQDTAIFAVAHSREVGVDVERIREDVLHDGVERRFLSEREQAALAGLPHEARLRAIFQCWTAKEAYLKASGLGLRVSMADLDVSLLPDGTTRLNDRSAAAEPGRWSVYAFEAGPDSTGAVAVEGYGMRIPRGLQVL
jgi:4'-phosphopantetheinyl transferase